MAEQPPNHGNEQPPPYQPPPPNPLIPPGSQPRRTVFTASSRVIWAVVGIVIVILVLVLLWSVLPKGEDTSAAATRIALEETITQNAVVFITQTFLATTPTIDPQIAALQTQNALLAQSITDQAGTAQAIAAQPTQPPVVITQTAQIIVQPTQPPIVITSPPVIMQPTIASSSGSGGVSSCASGDIASLPDRPNARINDRDVALRGGDTNACVQPLFYDETGIAKGKNYTLNLPQGWAAITASITAEIQANGGQAHQYRETPVIVIQGPFNGGVGLYEGAIRIVPEEWGQAMVDMVLPIQRTQTQKPSLQAITFSG